MGVLYRAGEFIGGISKELVDKIGSVTLTTTAKDLSGAVNELNTNKATKATTLSGYGITDAKIENGTITLGSNNIIPLTSASTLNAAKLSGTIPSECYTDTNNAVTQTATDSTNSTYELLFSGTADNTTRTEGVRKSSNITCNPYSSTIEIKDNTHRISMLSGGLSDIIVLSAANGLSQTTKRQWVSISDSDISIGGSSDVAVANRTWDGTNTSLKSALAGKVSKSGDTMTGNLNTAGNFWTKRTNVTIGTTSNNGVSSGQEGDFGIRDKNDYWFSRVAHTAETNGRTNLHLQVRNTKTDGTNVTNEFRMAVEKTGTTWASLDSTLMLKKTTDASGTANNKPALIVGGTDAQAHIEIDNNEIIAKENGTTLGTLYLQDGGALHFCADTYWFDKGRLNFAKVLTNSNVTAPNYVVGLTNSWGAFGYTALSALATTMLKVQETKISFKFSVALGAHSGMTFANARGSAFSVSVPSGYTLMCNVYCCANGFGGLWATLDGDVYTSTSPGIYLYNSSNSTLGTSTTVTVRVVSIFRKS